MLVKIMYYACLAFWASLSVAQTQTSKPPLTLFIWEDYVDESVLEDWQAETGIPIKQVYYDDEAQSSLVISGHKAAHIDVVLIGDSAIKFLSQAGHLFPVNKEQDRDVFWPDACGTYGRHYLWGTYGIVYRSDKVKNPITSWYDLLKPTEELSGHIGMLGQADELISPSLAALGYPVSSTNDDELKEAFDLLKKQSPHVATYDYIYTYTTINPDQDEIWAATAYSGDHVGLNELQGSDNWQYVIPKEGAIVWVDCLAITMGTKRKQEAQAFIDFLSRKEMSARSAETLGTATPYKDALPLLSSEALDDTSIYLDNDALQRSTIFKELKGADILKRTRIKDALIRYHDIN